MPANVADGRLQQAVARLAVGRDGEDFVLGRPDLGVYVAVPEPGAVLIVALQNGADLAAATEQASRVAGQDVDGHDFITGLAEAGLLDGEPTADGPPTPGRQIRWIEAVSPAAARRLFGRAGWTIYVVAAAFVVGVFVLRPDLRPTFEDIWFLPDQAASLLLFLPVGVVLTALHETWHWLAGRALGVPAVFRVSRRGIFLVFETDLSQIVTTPRRQRYVAYLAGICIDCTVLAATLGARLAYRADVLDLPPTLDRILGVVVLSYVTTITWQVTAIALRNDGYAILANALRCHNLYRATWLTTKNRLMALGDAEAAELAGISPHDRRVARWFGVSYLASLLGTVWLAVNFGLPSVVGLAAWTWRGVASGAVASVGFWESSALLAVLLVQVLGPVVLARRERRSRREGRLL